MKNENSKKQIHKVHQRQNFGLYGSVQIQWYPYSELFFKKNITSQSKGPSHIFFFSKRKKPKRLNISKKKKKKDKNYLLTNCRSAFQFCLYIRLRISKL